MIRRTTHLGARVSLIAALTVTTAIALTGCTSSAAGSGSPVGASATSSESGSEANDSPAFTISDDELSSAFLTSTEMTGAIGRALDFSQSVADIQREDLFAQPSELPKATTGCLALAKRLNTAQYDAMRGHLDAKDGTDHRYRLDIAGLADLATQRVYVAGYGDFPKFCSTATPPTRWISSKSAVSGAVGLEATGSGNGNDGFSTVAGYGNLLIIGTGPTQDASDRIVVAERKHLDAYVSSR